MLLEDFFTFLDRRINLSTFEDWIYKSVNLEEVIGEDYYQFLLEFNYRKRGAEIEVKEFVINNITGRDEFINWKIDALMKENDIQLPEKDLFLYAKQNPTFLKGKQFTFQSYRPGFSAEIFWIDKVYRMRNARSIFGKYKENYLHLGSFDDYYIHLEVNPKNEIWISYDVITHREYFAIGIKEAIKKIFASKL